MGPLFRSHLQSEIVVLRLVESEGEIFLASKVFYKVQDRLGSIRLNLPISLMFKLVVTLCDDVKYNDLSTYRLFQFFSSP